MRRDGHARARVARGLPALVLCASLAVPARAAAPGAVGGAAALAAARATAERLAATVTEIRADLTSGSFERVAQRLAAMADVRSGRPVALRDVSISAAIPRPVAAPIADLWGAARAAARSVRAAMKAHGGRTPTLAARSDRLGHEIAWALATGERIPAQRARRLKARVVVHPVLRAATAGGLGIGAALDRSLRRLTAAAATLPARTTPAPACDVLDERPQLCINGTGPNTVDAEAVLVVDLGGDDTYVSSAGGANSARCVDDPDDVSCNASLLVDLCGDDTYRVEKAISHHHLVAAGSALTGVGMLVDVAGDDSYLARVPARDGMLDLSYVFGSANLGVGMLADLAGDDIYEMTIAADDSFSFYSHGASLDGMGALLDLDGSNAYRVAVAGPEEVAPERGAINILNTMAVGVFGAGAIVDRTGYATFEASIDTTAGPRSVMSVVNPIGQGTGLVGDAALLTGSGPTTYIARGTRVATADLSGQASEPEPDDEGVVAPTARLPGSVGTTAQGIGVLGMGVVDDLGGDDTYTTIARSEHRLEVTAQPGCDCDRAIASLDVTGWDDFFGGPTEVATTSVSTQGVGSALFVPDAGALVHDHGGDDDYIARADQIISARADNRLEHASAGARAEALPARFPEVRASGQGLGSDFAPTALLDDGGDDTYELVARATSVASADAVDGPRRTFSVGSMSTVQGQGASAWDPAEGALLDLGGSDSYASHSISRATTSPVGPAWNATRTITAQGGVGGVIADLDDGLVDRFTATPERGPGVGVRGEGPGWVDVLNLFPGYGFAPLQPARRETNLAIDPTAPSSATGGLVAIRARLTSGGIPLSGLEVTFEIEDRWTDPTNGERWVPHRFAGNGITDDDGWAVGYLDIDEFVAYYGGATGDLVLRIAARFHGDAAHGRAVTTKPFAVGSS